MALLTIKEYAASKGLSEKAIYAQVSAKYLKPTYKKTPYGGKRMCIDTEKYPIEVNEQTQAANLLK